MEIQANDVLVNKATGVKTCTKRRLAMNDIKVGSKWVGKSRNDIDCTVVGVIDNEVKVECEDRGNWFYYPVYDFLSIYKPKLGENGLGADMNNIKVGVAPDMSVAIGDVWQARCDGTNCKVMDIEVDEGVTWVTTQSVDDEDAVESDTLRDFFEMYRFIGRVEVVAEERDAINPDHYQSDPSGVQCIAISENWSFCLGNALKYMWRSGKKDSSKNIEDLQKAVWYIEREISRLDKDSE